MGKPQGRNGREHMSQCGQRASFKSNIRAFHTGVHRCLVVATGAALLIGSTSWKSTLLLGPVLIYYELNEVALGCRTRFRNEALGGIFPGIARLRLRRRHRGRSDPKRKGSS